VIKNRFPTSPRAAEVPESSLVSWAESETSVLSRDGTWYLWEATVRLILHTQRFQPYTFVVVQELTENARMNRLFFLCKFMEVKQTVPNLENKFLWMLVYIFNEVMIWMCKIVCMRQLEILTILMDNHFIHETCWYVVLFVGLQFLALALLNVNMAKTVTLAAECYWRWCEMSNYSFKKWVTNEIMVLTRQGYISYVWIVYEFFIWQFCWVAHF